MITSNFNWGFCNRLYEWEILYAISNNSKIALDLKELDYINIPNTENKIISTSNYLNLKVVNNINIDENIDYCVNSGWDFSRSYIDNLYQITYHDIPTTDFHYINSQRPIKKISIKNEYNHYIDKVKNTSNIIGLHVRKGDYVALKWDYPIQHYINICQFMVEQLGNVTFYLATNGTDEEIKPIKDKFNVIDNQQFKNNKHLHTIIDLFCLANTNLIIGSASTYTMVASELIKPKVYTWAGKNYKKCFYDINKIPKEINYFI